jgi:hypothetical protein
MTNISLLDGLNFKSSKMIAGGNKFQKIRSPKSKKNEEKEDFKEFKNKAKRNYDKAMKRLRKKDEDESY